MLIGIFSIATLIASLNGNWGAAVVGGVIVLVLVFMISEDRKDMRAYYNRRDYMAYGKEPDWKRRKR